MDTKTLTGRQKLILGLIVQEYVETAKPVGSKKLVDRYNLDFSSATLRNEMAKLSKTGYLRQPLTSAGDEPNASAGRIPTEEGYRFFVGQLMQRPTIPASTRHTITHQFYQTRHNIDQWMRLAASVLAHQSKAASLVTTPQSHKARFKHLELILTAGRQVLMVVVLTGGRVRQQMLVLAEPVSQEKLSAAAGEFNKQNSGRVAGELGEIPSNLDALGQDMFRLVFDELNSSQSTLTGEVYHDGWTNVLAEPEFSESGAASKALRVLEERSLLEDLLEQTVMNSEVGGIQVLIGGEGTWEELSECSLVLARYGTPELATGILGVLGPLRMSYGQAVSTVNFVGGLLSDLVRETMSDEK
ncbi:MAG: heat-inducible transcription repressor HrcA [Chloroflexi bacterium]|nr:heat-inducible transcription repressor HrcA [Chloroflexota bacterium]